MGLAALMVAPATTHNAVTAACVLSPAWLNDIAFRNELCLVAVVVHTVYPLVLSFRGLRNVRLGPVVP
jgi:hypothetical protein